jgi:hypothetical protein
MRIMSQAAKRPGSSRIGRLSTRSSNDWIENASLGVAHSEACTWRPFFSIRKAQPAGLSFSLLAVTYFIPFFHFCLVCWGGFGKCWGWHGRRQRKLDGYASRHYMWCFGAFFWCAFLTAKLNTWTRPLCVYEVWLVVTTVCIQSVVSN